MAAFVPRSDEWLAKVTEPIIDPDRLIVDPHHHLWDRPGRPLVPETRVRIPLALPSI